MASPAGICVVWVQPAVEMWPPRTSTETSTRGPNASITASRKSTSRKAAVPMITRSAPARSASRTAGRLRRPPPYWTGTPVSLAIRRRCSIERGSPERAPSRSTTWRKRAPASTHDLAASSGSSW